MGSLFLVGVWLKEKSVGSFGLKFLELVHFIFRVVGTFLLIPVNEKFEELEYVGLGKLYNMVTVLI